MMGNVNVGMKRRMLSLGHIIWMMRRTASKTICLLRWQNCGQIIAVKSVAYISMAYCAQNEWNWSLVIDHNHKRNFENNISLEQLITTLPHQRVVWQLRPTAPLPNIGLLKKVNKVEPKSCRLRRRGKEFVWQIHMSHSASDKSNQSRVYLKVQPFEDSRKRKRIADGSFQYRGKAGLICGSRERWMGLAGKNINRNWWGKCHGFHKNAFS